MIQDMLSLHWVYHVSIGSLPRINGHLEEGTIKGRENWGRYKIEGSYF